MVEIICKLSGLKFEAANRRSSVHPDIAGWKQYANKRNWYGRCMEALEYGKANGLQTIAEFNALLERAEAGKPLKIEAAPDILPDPLSIGQALTIAKKRIDISPEFSAQIWHKGDRLYIKKGTIECGYCCLVDGKFGICLKHHRDEIVGLLGNLFGAILLSPQYPDVDDPERAALVARYGEAAVADAEDDVARENWDI